MEGLLVTVMQLYSLIFEDEESFLVIRVLENVVDIVVNTNEDGMEVF